MTDYAIEFFNLYNLATYLNTFKILVVSKILSSQEFSAETIFINNTNEIGINSDFLELTIEHTVKYNLTKNKCYLPKIPFFDHNAIIPKDYKDKGIVLAYFSLATSNDLEKFPVIIEFPENRFVINFDIYRTINFIRREKYFIKKRPLYTYSPISLQIVPARLRQVLASKYLRRKRRGTAAQPVFPSYPKDYSVEILTNLFLYCVQRIIKTDINLNIWPKGKKYAFIVTHDVDSGWIYRRQNLNIFMEVEKKFGIQGAWFFVANLYKHDFKKIDMLFNEGHEIGLHGHNHDHKIAFISEADMHSRLSNCRWFIDKYRVIGFRSPHYLRTPRLYEVLRHYVKYDTSMHDSYNPTSKLGLTREGASSICPFRISEDEDSLVELPITIPEDFEVYDSRRGSSSIIEKQLKQIDQIKRRKGMAVLVVHPEPHLSARKQFFEAFKEILHTVSLDSECWICRPRDIYQYWIDKEKKRYGAIEKKCIYS